MEDTTAAAERERRLLSAENQLLKKMLAEVKVLHVRKLQEARQAFEERLAQHQAQAQAELQQQQLALEMAQRARDTALLERAAETPAVIEKAERSENEGNTIERREEEKEEREEHGREKEENGVGGGGGEGGAIVLIPRPEQADDGENGGEREESGREEAEVLASAQSDAIVLVTKGDEESGAKEEESAAASELIVVVPQEKETEDERKQLTVIIPQPAQNETFAILQPDESEIPKSTDANEGTPESSQPADSNAGDMPTIHEGDEVEPKAKTRDFEQDTDPSQKKYTEKDMERVSAEKEELAAKVVQLEAEVEQLRSEVQKLQTTNAQLSQHQHSPPPLTPSSSFTTGGYHQDIESMSLRELKQFILSRGLQCDDCFEKADLIARAREAENRPVSGTSGGDEARLSRIMLAYRSSRNMGPVNQLRTSSSLSPADNQQTDAGTANDVGSSSEGEEYQEIIPQYNPPQQGIYLEGWLLKSPSTSPLGVKRWRRRWFILTNRSLIYYKSPTSLMPLCVIELLHSTIHFNPDYRREGQPREGEEQRQQQQQSGDEQNQSSQLQQQTQTEQEVISFKLQTPHRDYIFVAENGEECKKWVTTTGVCIDALKEQFYFERQKSAGMRGSFRMRTRPDGTIFIPGQVEALAQASASSNGNKEKSYYEWLEVDRSATRAQIREAYERLSRESNPKLHPEVDPLVFHMVRYAWNVLGNDSLRQRYDLSHKVTLMFRAGFVCLELVVPGSFAFHMALREQQEQLQTFNRAWEEYGKKPKKSIKSGSWKRENLERSMLFYSDYPIDRIFWQPYVKWESPKGFLISDSIETKNISKVRKPEATDEVLGKFPQEKQDKILVIEALDPVSQTTRTIVIELENPVDCEQVLTGLRVFLSEKYVGKFD